MQDWQTGIFYWLHQVSMVKCSNGLSSVGQLARLGCFVWVIPNELSVEHYRGLIGCFDTVLRVHPRLVSFSRSSAVTSRSLPPRRAPRAGTPPSRAGGRHRPVSSCSCSQESRECALTESGCLSLLPPAGQNAELQVSS